MAPTKAVGALIVFCLRIFFENFRFSKFQFSFHNHLDFSFNLIYNSLGKNSRKKNFEKKISNIVFSYFFTGSPIQGLSFDV